MQLLRPLHRFHAVPGGADNFVPRVLNAVGHHFAHRRLIIDHQHAQLLAGDRRFPFFSS